MTPTSTDTLCIDLACGSSAGPTSKRVGHNAGCSIPMGTTVLTTTLQRYWAVETRVTGAACKYLVCKGYLSGCCVAQAMLRMLAQSETLVETEAE